MVKRRIQEEFGIEHTTIQIECNECGQGAMLCVYTKDKPALALT